jgi:hypothetical protein
MLSRTTTLWIAAAIVVVVVATGQTDAVLRAAARGFGFGIGREISHEIMHPRR